MVGTSIGIAVLVVVMETVIAVVTVLVLGASGIIAQAAIIVAEALAPVAGIAAFFKPALLKTLFIAGIIALVVPESKAPVVAGVPGSPVRVPTVPGIILRSIPWPGLLLLGWGMIGLVISMMASKGR